MAGWRGGNDIASAAGGLGFVIPNIAKLHNTIHWFKETKL